MAEVHRLLEDLKFGDPLMRQCAVMDVVTHKEPILRAFLRTLKEEKSGLEIYVISTIGEMGILSTVAPLIEALGDAEGVPRDCYLSALYKILSSCKIQPDALEAFERGFSEGFAAFRKRCRGKDKIFEIRMELAKLRKEAAAMRNMQVEKRDVLLDDRPKPPSRGMVYRSLGGRPPLRR